MCRLLWHLMVRRYGALTSELRRTRRSIGGYDAGGNSSTVTDESAQQVRNWTVGAMDAASFDDELDEACMSFFFLLDFSHQFYIPFIILLGLIGNMLSCFVFLTSHLKMRSSSYYLAALATADFSFLFSLLLVWLNNNLGWRVFNEDGWCESVVYVSSVCSSLSVWLIVAFTTERFIAVQYPLHRPGLCTTARAKTIVTVLVVLALASHSYCFVTAGVVMQPDGIELCDMKYDYLETMRIVSIVDSVASLMAPLVMIITMNSMIMRNLFNFSQRFGETPNLGFSETRCPSRERSGINLNPVPSASSSNSKNGIAGRRQPSQQSFQSSNNSSSNNSRSGGSRPTPAITTPSTIIPLSIPTSAYKMTDNSSRSSDMRSSSRFASSLHNQHSITKLLLLISTVFVLLNLPSAAFKSALTARLSVI
ncbi:alpha-2C adrenergic receptor-like isoform X2 [Phymastichus coffea]|uniref:alpha-2C adrenergic receptor-like isoform X2 n=1 Tax=Phymastichus coffea TaxID=108790 RepID=UPI00273CC949|nr:alpha-2C adrenergic receptor-like isoform X2 [Phymastichus coffea]